MSQADEIRQRYKNAHNAIKQALETACENDDGWIDRGIIKKAFRDADGDVPRRGKTTDLMEDHAASHDGAFYHPDREKLVHADVIFTDRTLHYWAFRFFYSSRTDFGVEYLERLEERTTRFGLRPDWRDVEEQDHHPPAIPAYHLLDERPDGEQIVRTGDHLSEHSGVQSEVERIRTAIAHRWMDFPVDGHDYARDRIG